MAALKKVSVGLIAISSLAIFLFSSFIYSPKYVSKHRVLNELSRTKIYIYHDSLFVYKDLLTAKVIERIKSGVYVNFSINDSTKIERKIIMPVEKEIIEIPGEYIYYEKISYDYPTEINQKKIMLHDLLYSSR